MNFIDTQQVINFIVILAFILVLLYVLQKVVSVRVKLNQKINILQNTMIGTKERLLLIEINDTTLLIGATPNKIETLYVFDQSPVSLGDQAEATSFKAQLSNTRQKEAY